MDNSLVVVVSSIWGVLTSVAFSYIPGLRKWYAALDPTYQRLIMLGLLVLGGLLIMGSSCLDFWVIVSCDKAGWLKLAEAVFMSVLANQSTFLISPKPDDVREARNIRRVNGTY